MKQEEDFIERQKENRGVYTTKGEGQNLRSNCKEAWSEQTDTY